MQIHTIMSALSVFQMLKSLMSVIDSALQELHRPHAQSTPSRYPQAILGLLILDYLNGRSSRHSEALSPDAGTQRSENELPRPGYEGMISIRSTSI